MKAKEARPGPENFKRPESILVVVHTLNGEVLLLQRADATQAWQSVTGSMRWDERLPVETARRELFEETGLRANSDLHDCNVQNRYPIHPLWKHRYHPGQADNLEHVFTFTLPDRVAITLNPEEHSRCCWQPYAQALEMVRFATNRAAIELLMQAG